MPQIGSTSQPYLWLLLLQIIFLYPPSVFNGFACLSNPCIHGICLDDLNSTYFCYCIDGYTGIQCQTNWNECWSSPCQNGGVCLDGIASFNCTCPSGFAGARCDEDFNECESNPCWNNGTCEDGPNGYICQCIPGYSGTHCEVDVAVCNITEEARCFNGGVCVEGPGDRFSCRCQPGWDGFLCDTEVNECMSAPCQNGAVCIDLHANYACACLFGYTGRNCEEVVQICDKNPCKNGALCLIEENKSVCYCVPDFHGDICQFQYDECQLGPRCLNGGTCIDGIDNSTCSCPPNLTGVLCECLITLNNELDCTYISPSTTTISYPNTTYLTTFETVSSTLPSTETTITEGTTFKSTIITEPGTTITQVPNVSTVGTTTEEILSSTTTESISTSTDGSSQETTSTEKPLTSTDITFKTTEFSTEIPITSTLSTTETSTTLTTTVTPPVTTTSKSTEETTITKLTTPTTSGTTLLTEITTIRVFETTETSSTFTSQMPTLSTDGTTEKEVSVYSTISTTLTSTIQGPNETSLTTTPPEKTTELFTTTYRMDFTTLPNVSTTSAEQTTFSTLSTASEQPGTTDKESNRTFPEVPKTTTFVPTFSTFFTEEPSTNFTTVKEFETTTVQMSTLLTSTSFDTSTIMTTDATTTGSVDCTITRCKNGGTCIYTEEGHKCLCSFDAEGSYCETKLGIKNAAFNGNSFISHRLSNVSNISIEFEAKTLSTSGLLFFANLDRAYVGLYVENGFLMFKFSCGYQTMLLSETKIPINNGFSMNIKANLEFSKDFKHCDASIKVNDTLSMTGDQMAKMDRFSSRTAWLHLGGIPNDISSDSVPIGGFIGCLSNLKISGKKVYIYNDAEDGYDVTECSSLACLSNPCKNGASCTSDVDNWVCHCRNGFLGKMCEISICENNPCLFGGTCIPFSSSGYICLCPYGKHGHFCENDLKITEPYFSSTVRGLSSFIAYPLPEGISQKMEIKFRFTPTTLEQISILLFIGQKGKHDFYSDHLAVSFVKGYIMLTWNMGSGPRRIFTAQPIEIGARDYLVRLGYEGRRAWLYVENLGNVTGRSPGSSVELDIAPLLYLGGHHSRNFSTLPHDLPLHTGFSGCIFDVEVKSGTVVLPLQGALKAIGRAVGQCGTTECYDRSCQNSGACLHHGSTFMCLCQDNWFGPLCSSRHNLCDRNFTKCSDKSRCVPLLSEYHCDCSFGRVGKHCLIEENITDISFTGVRSYLSTYPIEIDSSQFNIEMEIRILKDTGVILFMGKRESSFVCLSLLNGALELKVHSSKTRLTIKDPLTIRSSKLLLKGVWHKVQIGVFGRKVYLYVDHMINLGILEHGFLLSMSKEHIYLGGLPDLSNMPLSAMSNLPIPYTGCLRHLSINEKNIPLLKENILSARNVIDCDGTPCGGESCQNGGTCWLDSFMNPHCACVEPYYGETCEIVPQCTDISCRNLGRCYNSTCSCHIGFQGGFCETEIEVKTPAFTGTSYLIVKKLGDKKRNVRDLEINKLYLNFSTAKDDGLLFWTKMNTKFLGLGLEKGYLKLAYPSTRLNKQIVELPPYYKVADGLWHNIELSFAPFALKIDRKSIGFFSTRDRIMDNTTISTNGIFYIGGIPTKKSLEEETNGLFSKSFDGCVNAFGTNMEKIVTDFSKFEGYNVNVCKIF